jgi:hypothetical protein
MSSNVSTGTDPNGRYLGNWMNAIYEQAGKESRADFRALQYAKAEQVKKSNRESRAIAKKVAQAFEEESK